MLKNIPSLGRKLKTHKLVNEKNFILAPKKILDEFFFSSVERLNEPAAQVEMRKGGFPEESFFCSWGKKVFFFAKKSAAAEVGDFSEKSSEVSGVVERLF